MNITFTNTLSASDFNMLRSAVGWDFIEETLAESGLRNSAFVVCVKDGDKTIGMGRVVTDYGYFIYISDVAVLPEYQGKGIGAEIINRIMTYIDSTIKPGQKKFISLFSTVGNEAFYEKYGFKKRPNETQGSGMNQWIAK